jgi:hypothetical protein
MKVQRARGHVPQLAVAALLLLLCSTARGAQHQELGPQRKPEPPNKVH